jgi:hypothetical protein
MLWRSRIQHEQLEEIRRQAGRPSSNGAQPRIRDLCRFSSPGRPRARHLAAVLAVLFLLATIRRMFELLLS